MADSIRFDEFLSKAVVLRYGDYKEWAKRAFPKGPRSNRGTPDDTLREEYTKQSIYWASKLKSYLEEAGQHLRGTPLPNNIFELKNPHAIEELVRYVANDPIPRNLAGLAHLYRYAPDQLRSEIKKIFQKSLPLEEAVSLLATRKGQERGSKELLRDLLKGIPGFDSLLAGEKTITVPRVPITDLAGFFPYLELEEQVLLLKQYAEQPEKVAQLLHKLIDARQDVTCFAAVADVLSSQDIELVAKRLRWSRRTKDRLRAVVGPEAWEALLDVNSLKATYRVEILQFLGDRIQTKEALLRDCLQVESQTLLKAALLANKYLPHLLTTRRDLMHRIAGELCHENNMLDDNTLALLATLVKQGVVQERDLAYRQKESLLKLIGAKKHRSTILEILTNFIKNATTEANISTFILQIGSHLVKLGEQQALTNALLPYLNSFSDDQIKIFINEFPETDLARALREELLKRNIIRIGCLPDTDMWQSLDLESTARLVYEVFIQKVDTIANLTCTLSELAYRHTSAEMWISRLPESIRTLVDALMMQPVQELVRKAGELTKKGRDLIDKKWEIFRGKINSFVRDVESISPDVMGSIDVSRYLHSYLTAINELESVSRSELEQRIKKLHESMQAESSPFTRYQKIKFHLSLLQSYLDSLEEKIIKSVGRSTASQFENLIIYLSDAGIPEGPFDQMYLRLLVDLGLSPVEKKRGVEVKFDPVRHRHLRLETPSVCTVYTYGVACGHSIICPATVI